MHVDKIAVTSARPTIYSSMTNATALLFLLLAACLTRSASAQGRNPVVGVDVCACQPATYEFRLDFALNCDNRTVGGDGITDAACIVNTEQQVNVTNFSPARITTIQILELNQDLRVIAQTPINGDYRSGDTFQYTSVIAQLDPENVDPNMIPKGLQVTLAGRNAEEQDLVNFWLIIFDNDCGVFPVVLEGQQIGWTVFSDLGIPPFGLCLAAEPLSAPPTESPSLRPTREPAPITQPVVPTTAAPVTRAPVTRSPTVAATRRPVTRPPTRSPTPRPATPRPITQSPVVPATPRPVTRPPTVPATPRPVTRSPTRPRPVPSGSVSQPHTAPTEPPVEKPHAPSGPKVIKCIPRPPLPKKKSHPVDSGSSSSIHVGSKDRGSKLQKPTVSKNVSSKGTNDGKGTGSTIAADNAGSTTSDGETNSDSPSGGSGTYPTPSSGTGSAANEQIIPGPRPSHFGDGSTGAWQVSSSADNQTPLNDDADFATDDQDDDGPPQSSSRGTRRGLKAQASASSGSYVRLPNKKTPDSEKSTSSGSHSKVSASKANRDSHSKAAGTKASKGKGSTRPSKSGTSKTANESPESSNASKTYGSNSGFSKGSTSAKTHDPDTGLPYCPATSPLHSRGPSKYGSVTGSQSGNPDSDDGLNGDGDAERGSSVTDSGGRSSSISNDNTSGGSAGSNTEPGNDAGSGSSSPPSTTKGSHGQPFPSQATRSPKPPVSVPRPTLATFVPALPTSTPKHAGSSSSSEVISKHVSSIAAQSAGNPWGFFGSPPGLTSTGIDSPEESSDRNIFDGHERQRGRRSV